MVASAIDFAKIAGPLGADDPCGPDLDLDGDPDFMNVMARLEGELPATYFRRDDEGRQIPFDRTQIDFPRAFDDLQSLLERTRDLRPLAVAAKLSLLNRDLAGFADSVQLIASLVSDYWESVHPRPEGDDQTLRAVVLQSLDDMPTVVLPMQHVPIVMSRRAGPIGFRSQLVAAGDVRPGDGEDHPDPTTIQASLSEADLEVLAATRERLDTARGALRTIARVWQERAGFDQAVSFPRAGKLLDQMFGLLDAAIGRRDPARASAAAESVTAAGDVATDAPAAAAPVTASPQASLAEVRASLAACLEYFLAHEPSSPAVLLIRQAQQLIGKSFIEVMRTIFPAQVEQANIELGDRLKFQLPLERLASLDDGYDRSSADGDEAAEIEPLYSRGAALARMRAVAAFYRNVEPSSPTPYLMDKACILAERDFAALVADVLPDMVPRPGER